MDLYLSNKYSNIYILELYMGLPNTIVLYFNKSHLFISETSYKSAFSFIANHPAYFIVQPYLLLYTIAIFLL